MAPQVFWNLIYIWETLLDTFLPNHSHQVTSIVTYLYSSHGEVDKLLPSSRNSPSNTRHLVLPRPIGPMSQNRTKHTCILVRKPQASILSYAPRVIMLNDVMPLYKHDKSHNLQVPILFPKKSVDTKGLLIH